MSHLWESKGIFPTAFEGHMLVSWKICVVSIFFSMVQHISISKVWDHQNPLAVGRFGESNIWANTPIYRGNPGLSICKAHRCMRIFDISCCQFPIPLNSNGSISPRIRYHHQHYARLQISCPHCILPKERGTLCTHVISIEDTIFQKVH